MKIKNQKENMSVIVSFIVVVVFIGLVIYIIMNNTKKVDLSEGLNNIDNTQQVDTSEQTTTTEDQSTSQKTMGQNTRTLDGFTPVSKTDNLEKIDLVVGSGAEVKVGDTVSVQYTGAVAATGEIFQSSKDFGTDPVTFPLANVIKGWTDGIPGMKVGGTRRLVIPADMAYGANPPAGSGIPANADLVFDVELVGIK